MVSDILRMSNFNVYEIRLVQICPSLTSLFGSCIYPTNWMQVGLGQLCNLVFRQIMNRVCRSRKVYKEFGSVLETKWSADRSSFLIS